MLATGFDDDADARDLLERWLAEDPTPTEFSAQTLTAQALTDGWHAATGGTTESSSARRCIH